MNWVLTAVLCVVVIELAVRFPFPAVVSDIAGVGRRALHAITARSVSDHRKEKALLAYARNLFMSTTKLAGCLAAVLGIAAISVWLLDFLDTGLSDFILSLGGVLFSLAVAMVYLNARKAIV